MQFIAQAIPELFVIESMMHSDRYEYFVETFRQGKVTTEIALYSNEGVCSWYDFAKTICELSNTDCKVSAIETKDYPTPATCPHYSLFNKAKIKQQYTISYWKDSLQGCLSQHAQQESH